MSSCNLDHPLDDVLKKLSDQKSFLPKELFIRIHHMLEQTTDQLTLNELFHLLKKYDLASKEEKMKRNEGIRQLISN